MRGSARDIASKGNVRIVGDELLVVPPVVVLRIENVARVRAF